MEQCFGFVGAVLIPVSVHPPPDVLLKSPPSEVSRPATRLLDKLARTRTSRALCVKSKKPVTASHCSPALLIPRDLMVTNAVLNVYSSVSMN